MHSLALLRRDMVRKGNTIKKIDTLSPLDIKFDLVRDRIKESGLDIVPFSILVNLNSEDNLISEVSLPVLLTNVIVSTLIEKNTQATLLYKNILGDDLIETLLRFSMTKSRFTELDVIDFICNNSLLIEDMKVNFKGGSILSAGGLGIPLGEDKIFVTETGTMSSLFWTNEMIDLDSNLDKAMDLLVGVTPRNAVLKFENAKIELGSGTILKIFFMELVAEVISCVID